MIINDTSAQYPEHTTLSLEQGCIYWPFAAFYAVASSHKKKKKKKKTKHFPVPSKKHSKNVLLCHLYYMLYTLPKRFCGSN